MDKSWSVQEFRALSSSDLRDSNELDLARFARGYFVTSGRSLTLGDHWRQFRVGNYTVSWDGRTNAVRSSDGTTTVVIIGKVVHLTIGSASLPEIADYLLLGLKAGQAVFQSRVYDLAGRYVVATFGPMGAHLQTDATGMRSAYYAAGGGVVASHAGLAATLIGDLSRSAWGSPTWFRETRASVHPGSQTEFESVRMLTPNMELNIATAAISRFGPYPLGKHVSAKDAAAQLISLARQQLSALLTDGKVLVSLTAGLDSRTTLALTRPFADQIKYFTYVKRKTDGRSASEEDMAFAGGLARDLGLHHQIVTVDRPIQSGEMDGIMRANSQRRHIPSVALAYRAQLPADATHIRSNIYEVGRAFFRSVSPNRSFPELSAHELARQLVRDQEHDTFQASVAACQDWLTETGFSSVAGYDPYDLLYWEIRMGRWLPAAIVESDIAHDTYTLVNSRRILELLLSVPEKDRLTALAFDWIIGMAWPELLDYPVNGEFRTNPASK